MTLATLTFGKRQTEVELLATCLLDASYIVKSALLLRVYYPWFNEC